MKKAVYNNISAEQARNGYTDAEMGGKLGITPTTYRNKLFGRFQWKSKEMIAIHDCFPYVSFEYLFMENKDEK